ncbi:MAG TPA: hypothetical protein VG796_09615 [Verrucomicrobiales bacterium]|nr:hypothetical protein [Verrucomicrobiales bacterium]
MKYLLCFFLVCAALFGLWQAQRLDRAEQREAALLREISAAKETITTTRGERASVSKAAPLSNVESRPLDIDGFFQLAGEISEIEAGSRAGKEREQLQTKIAELFSRLAVTPPATLKSIMEQLPESPVSAAAKKQVPLMIINTLAKSDPAAAADYALRLKSRSETFAMAIRSWASQDAAAASAWLDKAEREGTLPADTKAAELRLLLLPAQIAANLQGDAIEQLVKLNPGKLDETMAATVRLLTAPEQRLNALQKIAALPAAGPAAVAQFVKQTGREISFEAATALIKDAASMLTPAQHDSAAVAAAMARIDAGTPVRAEWLLNNLRDADREPAVSKFMNAWAKADFNGAATWLRNQAASPDHDAAVAAFAPLVVKMEPPSAVDWAATIANADRRRDVLSSLYKEWQAASPAEAEAYFQKKGLSVP